jgi:hypothetical protein
MCARAVYTMRRLRRAQRSAPCYLCCTMRFTSARMVAVDTASLHMAAPAAPQYVASTPSGPVSRV